MDENWWKLPKLKNSNTTFGVIFKHCESFLTSLGYFPSKFRLFYNFIFLVSRIALKSLKLTYLVTLYDRKFQVFKYSPKLTIFGIFNELLSTQNVNVARFARNVEWDFFYNFQTQWYFSMSWCQSTSSLSLFSPCHMYLSNPIINIFLMKVEAKFLFRCKKNLLIVIWKINVRRYWQIGIQ